MQYNPEIAFSDFNGAHFYAPESTVPAPSSHFLWKAFFLAVIFCFAAAIIPYRTAREQAMTSNALLEISNQDRISAGLPPLRFDPRLEKAAMAKAQDIFQKRYFSHFSPDGDAPWDFIKNQGFPYLVAGENLAINYTSPYELANDFLQSPSHRENLLSPFFSHAGMAVVTGIYQGEPAVVVVQMFARPQRQSASDGGQARPEGSPITLHSD